MGMINPALYWLITGVMLFCLGLALPGFVLFFFALGALVTALIANFFPIDVSWQLGLFIVVSLSTLFSLRGAIERRFFSSAPKQDEDASDQVLVAPGERGVVSATITPPTEGRINCAGSSWRATADEMIEEGEIVAVVCQKGLLIHVERV